MTSLRRPLFKYFGSKWKGSKHYPAPRYPLIVEPFAGSACYSAHYADRQVMLFDKDPEVASLWQWLIAADPAEVLRLPSTELPEGFDLRELDDIPREAQDLIRRWQRIGHCSCWTVSSWNCKSGMWGPDIVQHVADSLPLIRHWEAFECDYRDIPVAEIGVATWFVDPLYQHAGNGGYECDDRHDYAELARWVRSLPGQVIVCEQEGADWLPFRPSHDITGIKRRVHHKQANSGREMIWANG